MINEFACVSEANTSTVKRACRFVEEIGKLPQSTFAAANKITDQLLKKGWWYQSNVYCLQDMLRRKAGNCLGLSCFFGAVLESNGFEPKYELITGPKGFQQKDEESILNRLVEGEYFSFDQPLMPERPTEGEKLYFATLEHPRLVLDGEAFETTTLEHQGPSTITGENIRPLQRDELLGSVLFERGHQARVGSRSNFTLSKELLLATLERDPKNQDVYTGLAQIACNFFDDDSYEQACNAYLAVEGNYSEFFLERYLMLGNPEDLDRVLGKNPTNMIAWWIKNVVLEKDLRTKRANCAVAAQCIARSEVLDLGDTYSIYAYMLQDLFPDDAFSLIKGALSKKTNRFSYGIALAMLGDRGLLGRIQPQSPLEEVRLAFAFKYLDEGETPWKDVCNKFGESQIFQRVASSLERQWEMVPVTV